MAEKLGSAILELRTDASGYTKGVKDAERRAKALDSTFKGVGKGLKLTAGLFSAVGVAAAGALSAIVAMTTGLAAQGEAVGKAAKRIGIGAEELQKLEFAAERSGASSAELETALRRLSRAVDEVATGKTSEGADSLLRLGSSIEQAVKAGEPLEKLLPLIADRFAAMENPIQKAALAQQIFGRAGTKLIPLLNEGSKGIKQLTDRAEQLGIISAEVVAQSEDFDDAMTDVRQAVTGVKSAIAADLLPQITETIYKIADWIAENKTLIAQEVKGFIDGIKVSVDLLRASLSFLTPDIKGVTGEFNSMTVVMATVNEALILIAKGILHVNGAIQAYRASVAAVAEASSHIPRLLGGPDPKDVEAARQAADKGRASYIQLMKDIKAAEEANIKFINSQKGVVETDALVRRETEKLDEAHNIIKKSVEERTKGTLEFTGAQDKAKDAAAGLKDEIISLRAEIEKIGKTPAEIIKIEGALKGAKAQSKELGDEWVRLSLIKIGAETIESIKDATMELKRQQLEVIATADELIEYKVRLKEVELAEAGVAAGSEEARKAIAEFRLELQKLDFVNEIDKMLKGGKLFDPFTRSILKFQDQIIEHAEKAKDAISSLDVFIGNVASNISETIANMLTAAFTGNFDDIKRSWKDMLKNMLNTFLQFIAAVLTNPIRVALEAVFKNGGGGIGGLVDVFKGGAEGIANIFKGVGSIIENVTKAIPLIGAIVSVGFAAFDIISGLFKKTPRLDIDFDSVKTEIGRRAAVISEILDPEFFADSIAQISVKRGGVGLGAGGDSAIKKLIQERLTQTIEGIQAIISTLPTELFKQLNETLLNAELDIDTVIGGERLLEFDAKGKKIAEKFQAFIEGELPAKLFAAIRESFFDPAFQALGVSADATQNMIDQFLSDLESAGSREARGQVGQAFLEDFATFVDAFNVLSGNAGDAIGAALNQINALSTTLGFDAVPSIAELDRQLAEFVRTADVDGVKAILELRNAISQLKAEILASISSIIGNIQSLNATLAAFGGASVDVTGFLNQAVDSIMGMLSQPGLSIGEQEALLGDLMGFANQLLAEEQAAFNAAQEAQTKAAEAQQAAIQNTINSLNIEKQRIEQAFNARIDALNEELRVIQDIESLIDGIRQNIQDLLFAPGGPESVFERISRAQAEVSRLFAELQGAGPEEQAQIGARLQDMLNELNTLRQEGFQAPSPESDALFRSIIGGLEMLEGLIEPARSSEDIQASIESLTTQNQRTLESIDAQIQSSQTRIAQISEETSRNTFKMSEELQSLFEYIRGEQIRILEERFKQLGEVSETGFATELEGLGAISTQMADLVASATDQAGLLKGQLAEATAQTGLLAKIAQAFGESIPGYAGGTGGIKDFGEQTLAFLHGKEAVMTEGQIKTLVERLADSGKIRALAGELTGSGMIEQLAGKIRAGQGILGEDVIPRAKKGTLQNVSVALTLPPISFAPNQVVNPDMFLRELQMKLHDRRISDEIVKIVRGRV